MNAKKVKLSPILKYPGGKEKELKYILPNLPENCKNYYEPFVGGGAVYLSLDSEAYFINDKSTELIHLYKMISEQNREFLEKLNAIDENWRVLEQVVRNHTEELVGIYYEYKNGKRNRTQLDDSISEFLLHNTEQFNGLLHTSFNIAIENFVMEMNKSLKYNHIRELEIETPFATAIYFFVRQFCYASMFRYNRQGKFNVPYGGISYNRKSILKKINYFTVEQLIRQLHHTVIENMDFEQFFKKHEPTAEDFVFLDPPYDTEFSTYAKNEFGQDEQKRLADYLIGQCRANFMLIIKNTEFIRSLYPVGMATANERQLYVSKFDKKYFVSFQDRNDKEAEHLMITNYPLCLT